MKRIKSMYQKIKIIFTPREIKQSVLVLFLSLITGLSQSVSIVLVLPFINIVYDPDIIENTAILKYFYDLLGLDRALIFLIILGSLIFVAVILSNAMMVLTIYAKTRFVNMRNHHLSKKLLSKYLLAPYSFFLNRNSSELSKNILAEVNQFTSGFLMSLFDIIINLIMLLVVFITIMVIDITSSITAVIVFGGLYGTLMLFFQKRLKEAGKKRLLSNQKRFKLTHEALASIKTTKVLSNEDYYLNAYSEASFEFAKMNSYSSVVAAFPRYIIEGVAFGGLMLFVVIQLALGRSLESLVPIVGVLGLAGYRMLPSLQTVFNRYSTFIYHIPILNILTNEFLEESEREIILNANDIKAIPFEKEIQLQNIGFKYDKDQQFALEKISLVIKKNQMVGFVGKTGSGKSTIIDILMGLLPPQKGSLMIDGATLSVETIKSWQKIIGYVPQEIYLSDASLKHNIAFGVKEEEIDLEKVKNAASIAAIHTFVEKTFVGERGVRLSGGQRQRIGIARALYRNPEVIVFDEATSALDNKTEKEVLKAINNASKDRTSHCHHDRPSFKYVKRL